MSIKPLRSVYQIKVSLAGSKPFIWRRILALSHISLGEFHEVLQISMGWTNSHLHQFISGHTIYGIPDDDLDFGTDMKDERNIKLSQILKKEKDSLIYEYDFGDGWEHKVVLEKILPYEKNTKLPICIKGERACPPENCGGTGGYQDLIEAIQDQSNLEHEEMLEWVGDEFNPEDFNLAETNELLAEYCG